MGQFDIWDKFVLTTKSPALCFVHGFNSVIGTFDNWHDLAPTPGVPIMEVRLYWGCGVVTGVVGVLGLFGGYWGREYWG